VYSSLTVSSASGQALDNVTIGCGSWGKLFQYFSVHLIVKDIKQMQKIALSSCTILSKRKSGTGNFPLDWYHNDSNTFYCHFAALDKV
jgi:hypothetical protein